MHRLRWRLYFKKLRSKLIPFFTAALQVTIQWARFFLIAFCLLCVVWWIRPGEEPLCDGEAIQRRLCLDFRQRIISGHVCSEMCSGGLYQLSGCDTEGHGRKPESTRAYQVLVNGVRIGLSAFYSEPTETLREGTPLEVFSAMVNKSLLQYLGPDVDIVPLSQRLLKEFDFNADSRLNYGEANSLWKLLHQPQFLNNFVLQETGVVPLLNGTCGGLSLWHDYHREAASPLYNRNSLWPFSVLFSNAYRMTFPSWARRAKVMMSLFEFADEVYETHGIRFHLCNITSNNLYYYDKKFEILISDSSGLMPANQIQHRLSNRTCRHDSDCYYGPQCTTKCDASTQTCTGVLVRPTLAGICDTVQEYLTFEAPKELEQKLSGLLRQCHNLRWFSSSLDIQHSILLINIKKMLWSHLQNLKV